MKISIIIATYNAAKTLNRCLDSIVPQLTDETELILVDGGSKDDTNKIIDSYGDKVAVHISEPDKGIYDAWNKGVSKAKGDWVMFVGADDILLPGALDAYLDVVHSTSNIDEYDYICAHNEYVDKKGKLLKVLGGNPVWSKMRRYMVCAHVASLHNKKSLFDTIGGYNLDFKICADYELLMRKKNELKSLFIENHIARMEVGGMSFSIKAIRETYNIRKLHHSIPIVTNLLLLIRDIVAYKFFIFRKSLMGGRLHRITSKLISSIKHQEYHIDEQIPFNYLLSLCISKVCAGIYGKIRMFTFKSVYVSPSATIKCSSKLFFGAGLNIGPKCYIDALSVNGLVCGNNVSMGYMTYIALTGSMKLLGKGMKIGNNVGLGSHGCYGSGAGFVEIGDNTIFGNYVSIHPENHVTVDLNIPIKDQGVYSKGGVKIGSNCWIGAKVTILDGSIIGNGCIVAAGAVVSGVFPDNCIVGGVPAKILKYRE